MSRYKIILILILALAIILRIYRLGENPPSLYWDEASLGYNAYSILTSGRDEHGEILPIARFIAFGDYKPPGYIYATVPSIYFFGLNEFAVRLPSALAGILMVMVTYLLVKEFFGKRKLALLAGFFLAVSPWAVHFSRAAFEANLAAFFNLLGVYLFVLSKRKKWVILPSVIFFILSFYTFNANRIIAPILLLGLALIYFKDIFLYSSTPGESLRNTPGVSLPCIISKNVIYRLRWILLSILAAILLILPSISYLRNRESKLRFQEVSIFNDLEPIKISNKRIELDGSIWWARLIHNRRLLFTASFLKHYFDNFTGRFLFTHGDVNPRLNSQEMGQLYIWDLPFLLIGFYWLIRSREKSLPVLLLWMLVAPIPVATARETPHALRILSILPTYQIIIAYGVYQVVIIMKKGFTNSFTSGESWPHKFGLPLPRWFSGSYPRGVFRAYYLSLFAICFLLIISCYYYLHNYYIHYPRNWSGEWQYGYKQMVDYVSKVKDDYDNIFITEALGRPYIYFAFYMPYANEEFTKERLATRDWFGFWMVRALGKIKFGLDGLSTASGRILLVGSPTVIPDGFKLLNTIYNLKGEKVFIIAEKQ